MLRAVQRILAGGLLAVVVSSTAAVPSAAAKTRPPQLAASVLASLNAERRAHHLKPLTSNPHLVSSAHAHNLAMAKAGVLSHQEKGEAYFATRIQRAGYRFTYAGENIGVNGLVTTAGALQLETLMYNEKPPDDGHRRNILNVHYTNVGIDVVLSHGQLWLTEDFGRPI